MIGKRIRRFWNAVRSEADVSADSTMTRDEETYRTSSADGSATAVSSDASRNESLPRLDGGMVQSTHSGTSEVPMKQPLSDQDFIAAMGVAAFTLDPDRRVLSWNSAMTELTGVSSEDVIGTKNAIGALYENNQPPEKAKSLAGWILEAPRNADTYFSGELPYEIEQVETGYEEPLYRIRTRITPRGGERVVEFYAAPIYHDGELVRIIETAHDRTDEVQRHEAITGLVGEVTGTLEQLREGRLDARASFEDPHDRVDEQLLQVITELNETADNLERVVTKVDETSTQLASSTDQVASAAERIDDHTRRQSERLAEIMEELHEFSARMEEVASTADQISAQAEEAEKATEAGANAGEEIREAIDTAVNTSDRLVERIEGLESELDEIDGIVEIITDVTEQTNILALNANIEAARTDGAGDGFTVVAEEVKQLAEETSTHTDEIAESIDGFKHEAESAIEVATDSRDEVDSAEQKVESILDALAEIDSAVESASDGISSVADANDEQATAVETVTSSIGDVEERATEMEAATEEIVTAVEQQNAAIDDLVENVDRLLED